MRVFVLSVLITIALLPSAGFAEPTGCNDGEPCNDGNPCTLDDYCVGSTCVGGTPPPMISYCTAFSPSTITIPSGPGAAMPYPSSIPVVAGSTICKVTLSLQGVTHTNPDDIDMMLSGPGGQNLKIMSDVGGSQDVGNLSLFFTDSAGSSAPDGGPLFNQGLEEMLGGGTYRPTDVNDGIDSFPAPAPLPSGATAFSTFNGTNPNGSWNLWVADDKSNDSGNIWGWCVRISFLCTSDAQCADSDSCTDDSCVNGVCSNAFQQSPPPPVQSVAMAADKQTISWAPIAGAFSYDIVSGSLSAFPVGPSGGDETCFNDVGGASFTDSSVPAPGTGVWYLVRAQNCYDVGDYGSQSNGAPRATNTCPQ